MSRTLPFVPDKEISPGPGLLPPRGSLKWSRSCSRRTPATGIAIEPACGGEMGATPGTDTGFAAVSTISASRVGGGTPTGRAAMGTSETGRAAGDVSGAFPGAAGMGGAGSSLPVSFRITSTVAAPMTRPIRNEIATRNVGGTFKE